MQTEINEVEINGTKYVRKMSEIEPSNKLEDMPYVIVRTYSAGVFAGYLEKREGKEVVIRNSRRIWYWSGANSLSQLAMEGTKTPNDCKFAMVVGRTELTEVIEILEVTKEAQKNIQAVPIWKK